jgi:hypothetical protein
MNRRLLVTAALVAAFGCGCATSPSIVLGEGYSSSPVTLPDAHGGGPKGECHDDPDLDLDEPAEVPEGYEEGDDSEFSPAHPLHLKKKKKPGVEENI